MQVEPLGSFTSGGPMLVTPSVHEDARGFFLERYRSSVYAPYGIGPFVQDNHSRSTKGVLRGLHWQVPPHAQGKLVSVLAGKILDVVVDLRRDAKSFGRWASVVLDDQAHQQLWIPPGFAHGFLTLSDVADVHYKTTSEYKLSAERSLRWDDPDVNIEWGLAAPFLSDKDAAAPLLRDLSSGDLFTLVEEHPAGQANEMASTQGAQA